MIAMIGTSDRLCWLAETCKILLLLLLELQGGCVVKLASLADKPQAECATVTLCVSHTTRRLSSHNCKVWCVWTISPALPIERIRGRPLELKPSSSR